MREAVNLEPSSRVLRLSDVKQTEILKKLRKFLNLSFLEIRDSPQKVFWWIAPRSKPNYFKFTKVINMLS